MSAPLLGAEATTSASGFEDGFGRRRLTIAPDDGAMLERLHLRPAFTIYERALRDAASRIGASAGASAGGRIVAPLAIERDPATGGLVAVSPFVAGERLADLLDDAAERARTGDAVAGIDVALGFLLQVLPTLAALRAATGLSHGVIAPARCVFTPNGRVVLTECGFAPVLERLNPGRRSLWRDFRVAMPPGADRVRFDETDDISQAAIAAVMLVLGRPPCDEDIVDVLPEWMADAIEIAQLRGNVSFAVNFQRFLHRALPLPGRRPYVTLDSALHDLRPVADAIGIDQCRTAIADCVRRAAPGRDTGSGSPVTAPVPRTPYIAPQPRTAPPLIVEAPIVAVLEEPARDRGVPKPGFESFYEGTAAAPVPEPRSFPAFEPADAEPIQEPALEAVPAAPPPLADAAPPEPDGAAPEAAMAAIGRTAPAAPDVTVPESPGPAGKVLDPLDPAAVARRRRSRSKARWVDALRSAVTRDAPSDAPASLPPAFGQTNEPMPPAFAPAVEPASFAGAPAFPRTTGTPFPAVPEPPLLRPVASEPVVPQAVILAAAPGPAVVSVPIVSEPIPRQPVFAPLAAPVTERLWESTRPIDPVPVAPPPPPVPVAAAPSRPAPIRLKTSEPGTPTPRPAPYDSGNLARRYTIPRAAAASAAGRRPSWKFAAAAAIIIATVAAAARVYLLHDPPLNAEVKNDGGPATVSAPPPVTTGTIVAQTQPEGARVLLDGSPAGETPLRIVDVGPGRHVLTFVTPTATVRRTVKVEANKTVTLDIPVFSGWVAIFAPVVLTVSEQGRTIGTTDQGRLLLPPGRHTLTLANPEFGYSEEHTVEIQPGEVRSLNVEPTGTLSLNAVPWAEVWIDGKKVGDTPIANYRLPLGTREITFKHPEFGERKVPTRVTAGAPIAVSVEFTR